MLKKLPNILTFIRLILIPVFVYLMLDPSEIMVDAALVVFVFAAITDYADGYIARKYHSITDFGKLMDPLADKVLVMAALVMLVAQRSDIYGEPWVPGWLVVLVLAREFWITGLRGVAAASGRVIAARDSGKVKSVMQMISVIMLLLHDARVPFFPRVLTFQALGVSLLFASVIISYWGAYEYSREVFSSNRRE